MAKRNYLPAQNNTYHWKSKGKKKRLAKQIKAKIAAAGLSFREISPYHYRIDQEDDQFDFWPTTGKWWQVGTQNKGQGTQSLLEAVRR